MPRNGMSVKNEINEILKESGFVHIGGEKQGEKTKSEYREMAKANGAKNSHEIAAQTPITKRETLDRYKETYQQFSSYGRSHGYGHDLKQFPPQVVTEFLSDKINGGANFETIKVDCTALNKLDNILNAVDGGARDWSKEIAEMRAISRETCPKTSGTAGAPRRFENPQAVIDNLSGKAKLVAEIQLTTGLRVRDALTIRLNDDNTLNIVSKGGFRVPHFEIKPEHAAQLRELAQGRQVFTVMPYRQYLSELKTACTAANEKYSGSHSFRHSFARNLFESEIAKGKSQTAAKAVVSEALFHRRLEIVERYIK